MFEGVRSSKYRSRDIGAAGLILIGTLLVFWFSPVHQVTDSHYSMLLSESLLKYRSFALDHFNLPRLQPNASTRDYYIMNGDIWQLELSGGRIYYYFPPGSSILALPYVALANLLGVSAANPDRTYNPQGELRIETGLAAILMAIVSVVFYFTSRLLLPLKLSLIIACAGAFGIQVWSTASRGLWSHTWATLLAAVLAWMLLANETGRRELNPIVLATLLEWLYFVRPNGSVVVLAVAIYVFLYHRRLVTGFLITGALWLGVFVIYSWVHFGKLLPSYYQANRLRFDVLPTALAGNLLSPSRGILIYVPTILFVIYLLAKYWRYLPSTRLVWLATSICALHIAFVSTFANLWGDWWGGASFGPRYTTELVPWLVLLAIFAFKARLTCVTQALSLGERRQTEATQANSLRYKRGNKSRYVEITAGAILLALSVFINGRGAVSLDSWKWSQPSTDQQLRALLWDWRHPQFLAGLQEPAQPIEFPLIQLATRVDFNSPEAAKYLWYGWSGAEKEFRWTDGKEATVVFSLNDIRDLLLEMNFAPFLASPQLVEQDVILKLNQQQLEIFKLTGGEMKTYSVKLPKRLLAHRDVLTFEFPHATAPSSLGVGADERLLGIKVEWMQLQVPE